MGEALTVAVVLGIGTAMKNEIFLEIRKAREAVTERALASQLNESEKEFIIGVAAEYERTLAARHARELVEHELSGAFEQVIGACGKCLSKFRGEIKHANRRSRSFRGKAGSISRFQPATRI